MSSLLPALLHGTLELKSQFMLGSNYTFLVTLHHEGAEIPAVYKPQRGENPLWDFPEASLAGREVAAYLVSEALGLGFVPLTVLRGDGPFGPGSLQQFIEYDPNYHYFTFSEADRQCLRPVVLFDLLINNADRKGSHVIIEKGTHKLWLIDHGLCFHAEDKLRTVLWDFAGEPMPKELLAILEAFHSNFHPSLITSLAPYLHPNELAALEARAVLLLANPIFPHPPHNCRVFPFPPL